MNLQHEGKEQYEMVVKQMLGLRGGIRQMSRLTGIVMRILKEMRNGGGEEKIVEHSRIVSDDEF